MYSRKMRRTACTGDNDGQSTLTGGGRILAQQLRSAMRAHDTFFVRDSELFERRDRSRHDFPVARRTHDYTDFH